MSLSRSRSRSRSSGLSSIAPTLVQESPVECPDTLLNDSEVDEDTLFYPPPAGDHEEMPKSKPQADIQDIQPQADIQTASSSGDAPALVEKPSDARSCGDAFAPPQGCSQAEAWEAPSRSASSSTLCTIDLTEEEPLLPIRSPPSLTQQQVHRMFNAADQRNFGWALNRMAGVRDIDTTRHPHARNCCLRVRTQLMAGKEDIVDDEVRDHFHRLIANRRSPVKPFYIGATTRHPSERFYLPTKVPHEKAYDGMIVGWVGTAANARGVESMVISMARRNFSLWCQNAPNTGGEGIAHSNQHASVYMCYGGKSSLLRSGNRTCPNNVYSCQQGLSKCILCQI